MFLSFTHNQLHNAFSVIPDIICPAHIVMLGSPHVWSRCLPGIFILEEGYHLGIVERIHSPVRGLLLYTLEDLHSYYNLLEDVVDFHTHTQTRLECRVLCDGTDRGPDLAIHVRVRAFIRQ